MQCIGRTKTFARCKREAQYAFCHNHRFQPVAALIAFLTFVGLAGGIYQDVWKPILGQDRIVEEIEPATPPIASRKKLDEHVELIRIQRVLVQQPMQSYASRIDRVSMSIIYGKLAKTEEDQEKASQQFNSAIQNMEQIAEQRQVIIRAAVQLESMETLDDWSEPTDQLARGLRHFVESIDEFERAMRAAGKQIAGLEPSKEESFATLLVTATSKKKAAIEMIQPADAKFATAVPDWPTIVN